MTIDFFYLILFFRSGIDTMDVDIPFVDDDAGDDERHSMLTTAIRVFITGMTCQGSMS
jgi:hypothetical protein